MKNSFPLANYFVHIIFPDFYINLFNSIFFPDTNFSHSANFNIRKKYKAFVIYEGDHQFGVVIDYYSFVNDSPLFYKGQPISIAKILDKSYGNKTLFISVEILKNAQTNFEIFIDNMTSNFYVIFKLNNPYYEIFLQGTDVNNIFKLGALLKKFKFDFKILVSFDPLISFWGCKSFSFKGILFFFSKEYHYFDFNPIRMFPSKSLFFYYAGINSLSEILSMSENNFLSLLKQFYESLDKIEIVQIKYYFERLYYAVLSYYKKLFKFKKNGFKIDKQLFNLYKLFFLFYGFINKHNNSFSFIIKNPDGFKATDQYGFKYFFKNQFFNYLGTYYNKFFNNNISIKKFKYINFTVWFIDRKVQTFKINILNNVCSDDLTWFECIYKQFKKNIKRKVNIDNIVIEIVFLDHLTELFDFPDLNDFKKVDAILKAVNNINKRYGKIVINIAG